jgi:hypothetical protein
MKLTWKPRCIHTTRPTLRALFPIILCFMSLLMVLTSSAAQTLPEAHPSNSPAFQPGESFNYVISWLGIPVGSATMEITTATPIEHQPTLRLVTTATSNTFLSKIFPVSNHVESTIDAQSFLPFEMVFQRREGKRHDDIEISFDRAEGKVRMSKNGETTIGDIPPDIHDVLSCLYYLRRQPVLEPGSSFPIHIYHDKKQYEVEARIEEVKSLKGPWGTASAIQILLVMPFQGIFLNEGNIRVWLTNDRDHTPLMMKAKVTIGAVKATFQPSSSS